MIYTLHYAPDNASLIIRLALEELGQPYRTALVDRRARAQDSAAYRALNPAGLIPVLETPDGPVSETAAILLWLSERHGALAPAPGDSARGAFLKWLFFTSNTLHADLRIAFYPDRYAPGGEAALLAGIKARLASHFALLEAECGRHDWLGGEGVSGLDLYLAPLMRWAQIYGAGPRWFDAARYPRLMAMAGALENRASVAAAIRAEGLGRAPFTAPQPCDPPEGSAL
ncbi:glutathione S-transferase [Pararhodobacter marinus]|uniref:Glutathione S-transferase n=1 Tax=Pararhodobacter marinus TaxID=2184063 RepID=A0A2U2C9K0_9RHOB|nr:glutathione S-transferase family protein [Pararhodobacter marinus]PWE28474.1 glutathione S-transferase [Pararhodobacter marinus]